MDVYLTDLQDPSAQAIEPEEQGTHIPRLPILLRIAAVLGDELLTGPSGRTFGPGARVKVSRARALVSFLLAKTLTAANPASQSGLMAAPDRWKGTIERTVPSRAYGRWTMFDQIFMSTGSRPADLHGVGGARRRAWVVSPARVIVLMGFRREWIVGVV